MYNWIVSIVLDVRQDEAWRLTGIGSWSLRRWGPNFTSKFAYIFILSALEERADIRVFRVKLPKSFLTVNLSESHTFHKNETSEAGESSVDEMKNSGELVEKNNEQGEQDEAGNDFAGQDSSQVDTPPSQFVKS